MNGRKSLTTYLLINVAVSALTALVVLIIWNRFTAVPPFEGVYEDGGTSQSSAPAPTTDPSEYSGQLQISAIIGAGDVENERVIIEHVGEVSVSLAGWRLTGGQGGDYLFPALLLHPGGSVELFSRHGEDSVNQFFWNREDAAWSEGELARLLDPVGDEQASYIVP